MGTAIAPGAESEAVVQQPDPGRTTSSPAASRDRIRPTTVTALRGLHLQKDRPVSLPRSL
jgi:hypothetical protein